jgi:hypothetical protein
VFPALLQGHVAAVRVLRMEPAHDGAAPVANGVAFSAGGLAVVATTWYVSPGFPSTLLNLAVALGILAWPLRRPWLLSRQRLRTVLVWWLTGGLLGAYVFGVFVLLAGLAVALALAVEAWVSDGSSTT